MDNTSNRNISPSSHDDDDSPDSKRTRFYEKDKIYESFSDMVDSSGKILTNENLNPAVCSKDVSGDDILKEALAKMHTEFTIESNVPVDMNMALLLRDPFKESGQHYKYTNPIIPIYKVEIGEWTFGVTQTRKISARIFYHSEKIGWEMSVDGTKFRIEFEMNDIAAINAEGDILKVELKKQPQFYQERDVQGRGLVMDRTADFTKGEALKHRIHTATFFNGELLPHFANICDLSERLKKASEDVFPSLPNYFL